MQREALYRESSLQNFDEELGVNEGRRLRGEELKNKKAKNKEKQIAKEIAVE